MRSVLALCFALSAGCSLALGMGGPGYGHYDYKTLRTLEEAIHRVASEASFLQERTATLVLQKAGQDAQLSDLRDNVLRQRVVNDRAQYVTLTAIKDTLKAYYHAVGVLDAALAGLEAITYRTKDLVPFLQAQLDNLGLNQVTQNAALDEVEVTLNETRTKLQEKLSHSAEEIADDVDAIEDDITALELRVSNRKCWVTTVEVPIDEVTAEGTVDVAFPAPQFFNGDVPTVVCTLTGVGSYVDISYSKGYGDGYGYGNDKDRTAVTADCKPFEDMVRVKAFDQSTKSHGYDGKNQVVYVYVDIRACTFAALSS